MVSVFPAPLEAVADCHGSFVVIEDDGRSNAATRNGAWTEYAVFFQASAGSKSVYCGFELLRGGFAGHWDLTFKLPQGDTRALLPKDDSAHVATVNEEGVRFRVMVPPLGP